MSVFALGKHLCTEFDQLALTSASGLRTPQTDIELDYKVPPRSSIGQMHEFGQFSYLVPPIWAGKGVFYINEYLSNHRGSHLYPVAIQM